MFGTQSVEILDFYDFYCNITNAIGNLWPMILKLCIRKRPFIKWKNSTGKKSGKSKKPIFWGRNSFFTISISSKVSWKKNLPNLEILRLIECKRTVFLKCLPVQIFHRLLPKNVSSLISFKWKKRNLMPTCNCFKWISNPICVKHSEQVSSFRAFWQLANTVCYLKARLQFTFVKWQKYYRIFQQVIEILMKIRQIEVRSALLS